MLTTDQMLVAKALSMPDGYSQVRLQKQLHPKHKEVLNALFSTKQSKVSFLAANSVGKSSSVGTVAILYALEMLNCKVIATSASYVQLIQQLVYNVKQHAHHYPDWQFNENTIKINDKDMFIAISTSGPFRAQGFHADDNNPLFIIIDEAAGIDDKIYEQLIVRNKPTYLLAMGSPLGPEGAFYNIETNPHLYKTFKHFKMNQFDCLKENGYWLEKQDIDAIVESWGGREHPLIKSSVYAEFASSTENGIVSLENLEKCYRNPAIPDYSAGKHVAIDFAAGGAESVIAFRNGNHISIVKAWRDKDTMNTAYAIVDELNKLKREHNITTADVSADADGLGKPIIDRIRELGWSITEFRGNSAPDNVAYKNKITECWLELAKKIRNCSIIIPNDQEFKMQLMSRKQYMHTNGKLALESKEDMASRGVKSPDRADAIAMACGISSPGLLTHIIPYHPKQQTYQGYF